MRLILAGSTIVVVALVAASAYWLQLSLKKSAELDALLIAAAQDRDALAVLYAQPAQTELTEAHISRAGEWFSEHGLNLNEASQMSEVERAQLATTLAYRFCQTGNETPSDLNALYDYCSTQCGGYTYLARGLAEAMGLETRYANLYNIPQQGNHTAMDVLVDGRWVFYDPTFGAFFTDDGDHNGRPMSLPEITVQRAGVLSSKVIQAPKDQALTDKPTYTNAFEHQYMNVENYRVPETIAQFVPGETLFLEVPIPPDQVIGLINETDRAKLSSGWLAYTNGTLNDDDPLNDTSYNTYLLNNHALRRYTILDASGVQPGRHRIRIRMFNPREPQRVQVSAIGKTTRMASDRVIEVGSGAQLIELEFVTETPEAVLSLSNMDGGVVELFGYELVQQ